MVKHANKRGEQRNNLSKRLSRVEAEVKQQDRQMPMPPEQRASARAADVAQTMTRLGGRSTSELTPDRERGSASPLERRKRR
jgi:hypothetical protein